jgi:hypothetical protein
MSCVIYIYDMLFQLNYWMTYRTEKNVDVLERFLFVRRVSVDNEQAAKIA